VLLKSAVNTLAFKDKFALNTQKTVAWISMPLWYYGCLIYLRCIRGYCIRDISSLREQYKAVLKKQTKPLIICANHLTKIDSLILQWGLGSGCTYFKDFKAYSWNLPEFDRFKNNPFFRFVCYLGCCIPIHRGGDREKVNRSMNKIKYLLEHKHSAMIFPEGKRSITGKIDTEEFTYGVGRLIQSVQNCEVLCIYLRGKSQKEKSDFPTKNEKFFMSMEKITPDSVGKGLRGTRDIASQIIHQLARMEEDYFASGGQ
jgi:hypothetical protein